MTGRPLFDRALTACERQRRRRARLRGELAPWAPKGKPKPPQFEDAFLEGIPDIEPLLEKLLGAGDF